MERSDGPKAPSELPRPAAKQKSGGYLTGLGCLVMIWAVVWIYQSGKSLWEAVSNRELTEVTYSEYVAKRPDAAWIRITDGRMMTHEVIYKGFLGQVVEELYMPVRGPGSKKGEKISVLLHTEDKQLVARIGELKEKLKGAKDAREELLALLESGVKVKAEVVGMAVARDDLEDKVRKMLEAKDRNLAEDYVVIEHHKKPVGMTVSIVMLLVAVALLVGAGFFVNRGLNRETAEDGAESAGKAAAAGDGPAVAGIPVAKTIDPDDGAGEGEQD